MASLGFYCPAETPPGGVILEGGYGGRRRWSLFGGTANRPDHPLPARHARQQTSFALAPSGGNLTILNQNNSMPMLGGIGFSKPAPD